MEPRSNAMAYGRRNPDEHGSFMLPGKSATTVSIERRAWRSEGTEANSFNDVFGAWLCARMVLTGLLHKLSLQTASSHRPIAFAPEGSSLDRCLPLNNPE
jgi:hypothetical protein